MPESIEQTRFFRYGTPQEPVQLYSGETLPEVTVAYETYGTLNPAADNAILLFHSLSGSQHAHGFSPAVPGIEPLWTDDCHRGWWDAFIGPGHALDTDQFFVICANWLGGCYGSTGPRSVNPETGRPWASDFPLLHFADIVDAQVRLLDELGIEQLHAVTGPSLGGMLAMNLAARFPERVRIV
ncbi:MAG: alpha/beta fold hydrolase, partial [Verrucomicrobiota bacterium]